MKNRFNMLVFEFLMACALFSASSLFADLENIVVSEYKKISDSQNVFLYEGGFEYSFEGEVYSGKVMHRALRNCFERGEIEISDLSRGLFSDSESERLLCVLFCSSRWHWFRVPQGYDYKVDPFVSPLGWENAIILRSKLLEKTQEIQEEREKEREKGSVQTDEH